MALRKPSNATGSQYGNREKAIAFINVDVKTKTGEKRLGAVPLYASKEIQALVAANADNDNLKLLCSINLVEDTEVELDL